MSEEWVNYFYLSLLSDIEERLYPEGRYSMSVGWGLVEVGQGRDGRKRLGKHFYDGIENSGPDLRFHFLYQVCGRWEEQRKTTHPVGSVYGGGGFRKNIHLAMPAVTGELRMIFMYLKESLLKKYVVPKIWTIYCPALHRKSLPALV